MGNLAVDPSALQSAPVPVVVAAPDPAPEPASAPVADAPVVSQSSEPAKTADATSDQRAKKK